MRKSINLHVRFWQYVHDVATVYIRNGFILFVYVNHFSEKMCFINNKFPVTPIVVLTDFSFLINYVYGDGFIKIYRLLEKSSELYNQRFQLLVLGFMKANYLYQVLRQCEVPRNEFVEIERNNKKSFHILEITRYT